MPLARFWKKHDTSEKELKLYRELLDQTSDFVLLLDSEGNLLGVNSSLCKRLGYFKEELVGMHLSQIDPSANPITWEQRWANLRQTGTLRMETTLRSKDGVAIACDLTANSLRSEGGELCLIILKDITERAQDEKRLKEVLREANQYRFAIEQAAMVLIIDVHGRINYVNDKFCALTGYSNREIVGGSYRKYLRYEEQRSDITDVLSRLNSGRVWRGEFCVSDSQGGSHWADTVIVPFLDEFGKPIQFMSIAYDITEKHLQAQKIQESEAALKEAQRLTKVGSFELDLATGRTTGSPQLAVNYGVPIEANGDYSAVDWQSIIFESDFQEMLQHYNKCTQGSDMDITVRVRRHDGTAWVQSLGKACFDKDGRAIKIIGTAQDITEKRRQDQLLKEHESKLMHASKMSTLGQMAGGVAHEINNPLAIIQGNAALLLEFARDGELDLPLLNKAADKIAQTVERIARIVQGLRTFAHDGTDDPFTSIKVERLVSETIEFSEGPFKKAGIPLILEKVDPTLEIHCRPIQITQVILNLLNNSLDAVQGRSDPWVRVEAHEIPGKDHVQLVITDSGPGIPRETAEKIMEPFFTTKEVGKGSGLGLSISSGIARAHRGSLRLDNESPNTRFILTLPKTPGLGKTA